MQHAFFFDDHHAGLKAHLDAVCDEAIEPLETSWLADAAEGGFEEEDRRARLMLERLAEAGVLRHGVPAEGATLDGRALCLTRERLAFSSGLADFCFAMQGLGSHAIALKGSAAQRAHWLPRVASGEAVAAFALTEPQAGSDVAALATAARRDGSGYVLNGEKKLISNAGVADFYTVFARTAEGRGGISAFVVPADTPGLTVSQRMAVLSPHPLGCLRFEECHIPLSARLGDEGDGWDLAFAVLDRFRPSVGAAALGLGQRALAEATERARARHQFGRPLARLPAIQTKLATMAVELEAARLLVYQAAWLKDSGQASTLKEAAMAKLSATEAAWRAVDQAVQIFGGDGVVRGSVVERLYREVRPLRIYEGASEVQYLIIAKALLKGGE